MKPLSFRSLWPMAGLTSLVVLLFACGKENSSDTALNGGQQISVFLTDNPALFEKVLVDIRGLSVHVDTADSRHSSDDDDDDDDNSGSGNSDDDDDDDDRGRGDDDGVWVNIPIAPGVYDLLQLRNGVDTLLGSANLPAGEIEKVRLTLGTNHAVMYNGVSYPLELPDSSSFIIKVDDDNLQRVNGQIRLHIDFDAGRSIVMVGNRFVLKPVLKSFCDDRSGRIEGRIAPKDALPATIRFVQGTDTVLVVPDSKDGKFKARGLADGTYSALISASNGYRDTVLTGLVVSKSRDLKLPVIQLRP